MPSIYCRVPGSSLIIEPHHVSIHLAGSSRASLSSGLTKSPQSKVKATKMDVEDGKLYIAAATIGVTYGFVSSEIVIITVHLIVASTLHIICVTKYDTKI